MEPKGAATVFPFKSLKDFIFASVLTTIASTKSSIFRTMIPSIGSFLVTPIAVGGLPKPPKSTCFAAIALNMSPPPPTLICSTSTPGISF